MPVYSLEGITPVVHPEAYVHETAVLTTDVVTKPSFDWARLLAWATVATVAAGAVVLKWKPEWLVTLVDRLNPTHQPGLSGYDCAILSRAVLRT